MARLLSGLAFFITITSAQPLPNLGWGSVNSGYMWFGPKTVYRGYSHYFGFPAPRWRVPVTCSSSGNTCNTSGSGYTPTGSETNVYVTASTPPTGLDTMTTGTLAPYAICNVSGTQFQLCRQGTATVQTFSSTGTTVSILITQPGAHSYVIGNTGWPAGTVLTWGYSNSGTGWLQDAFISANGNPFDYNHGNSMILRADIPTGATLGDSTITITTCTTDSTGGMCGGGGLSDTLTFTITVTAPTPISDANEPTSFPAIPGLSTWVSKMTSSGDGGGGDWCNKTTGATNPTDQTASLSNGAYVQYYDGPLIYWRVATWLRDDGWKKCTQNILQQIAWGNANSTSNPNGYILPNHGAVQGFQVFPIGYEKAISQDPRYIGVLQNYAATMQGIGGGGFGLAYLTSGCNPEDNVLRENAYALDTMLALDRMGLTPQFDVSPGTGPNSWKNRRQRCVDELLQMIDAYTNGTKRFTQNQYFITFYGVDALIHWWQDTKDPRVPLTIKPLLDQYYSNYNISAHQGMWNPEPNGPRCLNSAVWFNPNVDDHCQDNTGANLGQLHNLISHAFAWYWRISGDDTYRTQGDEIFSHAMVGATSDPNGGKEFSIVYRYSFNYVGWRQGWLSPERSIQ